jgi:hypothetical protein
VVTEQLQKIYNDFSDHAEFCRRSLRIRDKAGLAVPFELQPAQLKLRAIIEKCRKKRKPVRIIVLKARQVMISAGTAAEFFHCVPFTGGQRALIVAHENKASKNIFSYYAQLHDSYQPCVGEGPFFNLPELVQRSDDRGLLKYANNSQIEVSTANNVKTGRSASIRYLHASEFAFWRDAKTLMTGLSQCVPDDPDTMIVIESTANGKGGEFYRRCMDAMDPNSDTEWEFLFFAWWEHPQYTRPVPNKPAFQASLSREEQEMQERYHLTLEQLHWRRWAIKNNCSGSPETFLQEYPSNPKEAFLASGRPRFSLTHLAKMPLIEEATVGELQEIQAGPKMRLVFNEQQRGALVVYKRPQAHKEYTAGIDVAEGIDKEARGGGASDPDYSVANFFDRDTGEQVAKLRGRIEPGPFAEYVAAVARWYNWSFLVPEANGPGIAFLEGLLSTGYPPSLIYHRQAQPDEQYADNASASLQLLGWRNTNVTRVQLISRLDSAIREFSIRLHDPNSIAECESFVIKTDGKAEAQDGTHDDEVISIALGVIGLGCPPPDKRLLGLGPQQPAKTAPLGTVVTYGKRRPPERGERLRF